MCIRVILHDCGSGDKASSAMTSCCENKGEQIKRRVQANQEGLFGILRSSLIIWILPTRYRASRTRVKTTSWRVRWSLGRRPLQSYVWQSILHSNCHSSPQSRYTELHKNVQTGCRVSPGCGSFLCTCVCVGSGQYKYTYHVSYLAFKLVLIYVKALKFSILLQSELWKPLLRTAVRWLLLKFGYIKLPVYGTCPLETYCLRDQWVYLHATSYYMIGDVFMQLMCLLR